MRQGDSGSGDAEAERMRKERADAEYERRGAEIAASYKRARLDREQAERDALVKPVEEFLRNRGAS